MASLFKFSPPKAAISAALMGAMALSAAPAAAQTRGGDGIGAGEIIAGAVVLGGLAAILSSSGDDRSEARYAYDRRDRDYRGGYGRGGYDARRYGDSRSAVTQCIRDVERSSSRYGRTNVRQVTSVDRRKNGYRVKGQVIADNRHDRRWGDRDRYQTGKFTCDVKYGRVQDLKISGLRR